MREQKILQWKKKVPKTTMKKLFKNSKRTIFCEKIKMQDIFVFSLFSF